MELVCEAKILKRQRETIMEEKWPLLLATAVFLLVTGYVTLYVAHDNDCVHIIYKDVAVEGYNSSLNGSVLYIPVGDKTYVYKLQDTYCFRQTKAVFIAGILFVLTGSFFLAASIAWAGLKRGLNDGENRRFYEEEAWRDHEIRLWGRKH